MNWVKSDYIPEISESDNSLLIVYGTNMLLKSLPIDDILTPEERLIPITLRDDKQRNTWLACRSTLRLILGACLKIEPINIQFKKSKFGKLSVPNTNLFFSVSHSNSAFLLGFSFKRRIGIDLDWGYYSEQLPSITNFAFSKNEAKYCNYGKDKMLFAEIWTLKEAFLKAVGIGLIEPLTCFTVSGETDNDISRYNLKKKSFICPNRETGALVYGKGETLKFVCLT